jgi:hypothetical protein
VFSSLASILTSGGCMDQGNKRYISFLSWVSVLVLVVGLMIAGTAQSQIISGDLVGTVYDKTGAVVPNATVEAVNVDTNVKTTTQANSLGEYRLNNLPAGTYDVSVSAANFATTKVYKVRVELNKVETLPITLEVRSSVSTVEVLGASQALDTTTSQVSSTFEEKQMADLPTATVGLGVINLSLLSAGVASSGGIGAGTGPSVGGQRPRNNNFMIEGVDNNDKSVTGPLVYVPNDAVAEFTLLQNQFSPEFGHSSGGQFNQVIKSGTNAFHGTTYIYSQNRNFDAVDQSTRNSGFTSNQRFDNNRIGGTLGGPIIKDKLFFFGSLEYNPIGQATILGAPVCGPTAAGYAALDSLTGISANNYAIMKKYIPTAASVDTSGTCGAPATPGSEVVTGSNGSVTVPEGIIPVAGPNFTNNWAALGSIDWNISSKDQIRGRYIYNRSVGIDTAASLPAFYQPTPTKYHLVAINEYHTFTPSITNEFRVGYNRFTNQTPSGNFSFPGLDSFPNITLITLGGVNIGPDGNAPQFTIQNTYQISDAVTWTKGKHTMKYGIEGRKLISPQSFTQRARGDYQYNSLQQYLQDLSPDLFGQRSVGQSTYYADQSAIYFFVNDNWRVTQHLTVNAGLRYEYTTTPFGIRSQSLNNVAADGSVISDPSVGLNFVSPRAPKNDWGPRVGFAYSPGTKGDTSIRGGFGIAYDVHYDNIGILSLPPELSVTENTKAGNITPNFLADGGLPPGAGGTKTFATAAAARASTTTYYQPNVKDPKSLNWTLGVQHNFLKDYTAEVRYVGTRGIHLNVQEIITLASSVNPNVFLPTYLTAPSQATLDASPFNLGGINNYAYPALQGTTDGLIPKYDAAGFQNALTSFQPDGSSTYHGLAMQLTRRMSHGLQFVSAYTYSHLIDNSTADFHTTDITPRRQQDFANLAVERANSALDHRHRFTLALLYDMPYFKTGNFLVRNGLGNWEFAPVYTYQSGEWGTVQDGVDANLNGDPAGDRAIFNPSGVGTTGSGVTPLCTSAIPSAAGVCTLGNAFNTAATSKNPVYTGQTFDVQDNLVGYLATNPKARYIQAYYGALATAGRNTQLMPAINNVDFTAVKRIAINERYKVEFSMQAFNILNHPQFIAGSLNQVNSLGVTGSSRAAFEPQNNNFNNFSNFFPSNARSLQLSLKIFF